MHACLLERSDITLIKAFAHGARSQRIAALSAVSAGIFHPAVICFEPPGAVAIFPRNGWLS